MARGHRPRVETPTFHPTRPPPELPENRRIVIAANVSLLPEVLQTACAISPSGGDWTITCRSRAETDRLLGLLKLRGIHGIIKQPRVR